MIEVIPQRPRPIEQKHPATQEDIMRTTTFRTHLVQAATALSLGLMLTACGGGDGGSQIDRIVTGSSSSANSSSSSLDTTQVRDLGRGSGADFVPGEIATGVS